MRRISSQSASQRGFTLLDLTFTVALMVAMGGMAAPHLLATMDDYRAAGAARYLAGRLQRTRMEAVARSASVAVRFTHNGATYSYSIYRDGNRNGVLSRDIQGGVDTPIQGEERLSAQFPHVDFGALPDLPPVDPSSTAPGSDPLRIGSSNMLTFTPLGSSSSGSLYICGERGSQYVVRIYGETGRTRILKFEPARRVWRTL